MPSFTTREIVAPSAAGCPAAQVRRWPAEPSTEPKTTHCGYSLPGGVCGGDWPVLLKCASDADCCRPSCATCSGASAAGCCKGVPITCNASGVCGGGPDGSGICARRDDAPPSAPGGGNYTTGGLELSVNVQTSVVGLLFVELQEEAPQAGGWRAVPGFSLEESDPIRGNFVGKTVPWRRGSSTLSALAGKRLRIHAATADAKLFSITLGCSK